MEIKRILAPIFTAGLALAGCSVNDRVQFGPCTMSPETYNLIESENARGFDYDEMIGALERCDVNRDNYISRKEVEEDIKAGAAAARASQH